jgi:N-acylneuraminate cytidylyltransferase
VGGATIVALIPARAGSKRIKSKNTRALRGHPLLAYTIAVARQASIFADVIVSTECPLTAAIARHYGAEVPFLRPAELAGDHSPDIEWIRYTLLELSSCQRHYDCFSILRPTSPFRTPAMIQRAWQQFCTEPGIDSLRAVEKCSQHPGKMWVKRCGRLHPLLPFGPEDQPWHSTPYQALPTIYVQNASLEIAWTRVVLELGSITGETIAPLVTDEIEGFDLNIEYDWQVAELMLANGTAKLPDINTAAYRVPAKDAA